MSLSLDEAARGAEELAKLLLPERPQHLTTKTLDEICRLCPIPKSFWYTGDSGPLQYTTYVCDAIRGVLFTRPRFELCEEPDGKPAPVIKTKGNGVIKKKINLKDYQNRKKSVSPDELPVNNKMDTKQNGTVEAKEPRANGVSRKNDESTREGSAIRGDARADKPQPEVNGDRSKPAVPKPVGHSAVSNENRKRPADPDSYAPSPKRTKVEAVPSKPMILTPESSKGRERAAEKETPTPKAVKNGKPYPTVNGHRPAIIEQGREHDRTASPRSTMQVNGSRSHGDSANSTPRKGSRSQVPELLSPLHLSFDVEPSERDRNKKKMAEKSTGKISKTGGPSPAKKQRIGPLPPLLSPTLPPVVEAELAKLKETPTKDGSQLSSLASDSPSSSKKPKVPAEKVEEVEEREPQSQRRPSRIVTLKFKKANAAKRAKELLSLPSKSAKEAQKRDRSMSMEATPPTARKRPRPPEDEVVLKKTKTLSDALAVKPAPSTPHRSTAMSRVASTQSHGNTPGTLTGQTPGTVERPPTALDAASAEQAKAWRDYGMRNQNLGRNLKHARDDILKSRPGGSLAKGEENRVAALHLEMVLAYMVSFAALNKGLAAQRKPADLGTWESLMPHFKELRGRVAANPALAALAAQMHAVCLEEISHAFATLDPTTAASTHLKWRVFERQRRPTWLEAVTVGRDIDGRYRAAIGPWMSVNDAVTEALTIMGRWADRERVNWQPVIKPRNPEKPMVNGSK